jgi:hypothetical protein
VVRLENALQKIGGMTDFQEALKQIDMLSTPMPAAAYSKFILDENVKYRSIARSAKITIE